MPRTRKERFTDTVRDFFYRLWHYFSVCRCIGCGEIISEHAVFCEDCEKEWEAVLLSECGVCGRSLCRCLCPTDALKEARIHRQVKLYRYETNDSDAIGNRILYRLKENDIEMAFRFLGGLLAEKTAALLPLDESFVVTYLPRTHDRVLKHGFDQSKHLAFEVSRALALPRVKALRRTLHAKTQKKMKSVAARKANLEKSLRLRKRAAKAIAGKRVLLIDDVITSGASVCTAARLLRKSGAREVIALSLAVVTRTENPRAVAEKNSHLPYFMR